MKIARNFVRNITLLMGFAFSFNVYAQDVELSPNLLMFSGASTISIVGPNDYQYQAPIDSNPAGGGSAFISLGDAGIQADGTYHYEIKNIVSSGEETVNDPANGRSNVKRQLIVSVNTESGTFRVENGIIVVDSGETEEQ